MLVNDILMFDELLDSEIVLMDIDHERLDLIHRLMARLAKQEGLPTRFSATADRREAVDGADYVVVAFQVGGLEAYRLDVDIPLKYGVDQCVGDTLGPGGVFRGLRSIPEHRKLLDDMEELCPNAFLLNYANPMAINCKAIADYSEVVSVGLCHGVQHTANMLADWAGVAADEVDYWVAGINHMAWFLRFEHNGEDLYPRLWEVLDEKYETTHEKYRIEMMRATGYFMTESPGHLSEYIPYFRKRKDLLEKYNGPGFGGETKAHYNMCLAGKDHYLDEIRRQIEGVEPVPFRRYRSVEYAANIIHAHQTGEEFRLNGNVLNTGLITNLPEGSCVEVPCYVDKMGIHPAFVGDLPEVCAALNRTNVNVQNLAAEAGLWGDREKAYQAVLLDPLTAAVLSPAEIRQMVDEMFEAEKRWLPQFEEE
jgi:alpha-galactosidase